MQSLGLKRTDVVLLQLCGAGTRTAGTAGIAMLLGSFFDAIVKNLETAMAGGQLQPEASEPARA